MLRALLYKNASQFTKSYLNVDIAEDSRRHIYYSIAEVVFLQLQSVGYFVFLFYLNINFCMFLLNHLLLK